MEKKNKTGALTLPDCKTYYKSRQYGIGVKVDRLVKRDQRESLEVDPHDYGQLIFHRNAKAMQWRGKVFLTNDAGANGNPYAKKKKKRTSTYALYNT